MNRYEFNEGEIQVSWLNPCTVIKRRWTEINEDNSFPFNLLFHLLWTQCSLKPPHHGNLRLYQSTHSMLCVRKFWTSTARSEIWALRWGHCGVFSHTLHKPWSEILHGTVPKMLPNIQTAKALIRSGCADFYDRSILYEELIWIFNMSTTVGPYIFRTGDWHWLSHRPVTVDSLCTGLRVYKALHS